MSACVIASNTCAVAIKPTEIVNTLYCNPKHKGGYTIDACVALNICKTADCLRDVGYYDVHKTIRGSVRDGYQQLHFL